MQTLNLGIDDAGRGPVIGPMILAGVLINSNNEKKLKKLGVKDSKQLTPKRREHLAGIIKENAETFEIVKVFPKEIDENLSDSSKPNLNTLEAIKIAEVINRINKGFGKIKVFVDCPSTNITAWTDLLKTKIDNLSNLEISCEHKADQNYVSVSAASILAKSTREKEMDKLKEKYGDEIGSGYTSDPATIKFLEKQWQKHSEEGIFRKTWATWKRLCAKKGQKTLNL